MEEAEGGIVLRRVFQRGKKWDGGVRPGSVDAEESRENHANEDADEREPEVLQADGFVVGGENAAARDGVRG